MQSETTKSPSQKQSRLTSVGRRMLLGASLRLLVHRYECGAAILPEDLLRLASLADKQNKRIYE